MVRLSAAVAALLVLLMISGRMLTAACEIACSFDAGSPHSEQAESPTPNAHGCHESLPEGLENSDLLASRTPHSSCGHEDDAEPFVMAARSILDAQLHPAKLPNSTSVERLTSDRSESRLPVRTPRDASAAPAVPLRI